MSFSNFIRRLTKSQYFRKLVVRAIEDAILLMMIVLAIALVCFVCGTLLRLMGVG